MTTNETTPPVDVSKFVLEGFRSVPELWEMSTPELLRTEISNTTERAAGLEETQAFLLGQSRASELVGYFRKIYDAEQRKADRLARKELEAAEAAERERIAAEAKSELEGVVTSLLANDLLSPAQKSSLQYFRYIYLENKHDPEIASLFKGTTRDQRYQWKRRSIDMVEPLVSPTAKKYISERTKRKFASFDVIVRYADIFLFKTMEIK